VSILLVLACLWGVSLLVVLLSCRSVGEPKAELSEPDVWPRDGDVYRLPA
jgi:hypothetical protein